MKKGLLDDNYIYCNENTKILKELIKELDYIKLIDAKNRFRRLGTTLQICKKARQFKI